MSACGINKELEGGREGGWEVGRPHDRELPQKASCPCCVVDERGPNIELAVVDDAVVLNPLSASKLPLIAPFPMCHGLPGRASANDSAPTTNVRSAHL